MDEDKKDQNEKQRKSKELTATDRVAWAVKKEDLPPKKNTSSILTYTAPYDPWPRALPGHRSGVDER